MLIRRIDLSLPDSAESSVRWRADGTLSVVVEIIQTAFVEGVFTEEVNGWEVEGSAAGLAAAGLKDDRLGGEVI